MKLCVCVRNYVVINFEFWFHWQDTWQQEVIYTDSGWYFLRCWLVVEPWTRAVLAVNTTWSSGLDRFWSTTRNLSEYLTQEWKVNIHLKPPSKSPIWLTNVSVKTLKVGLLWAKLWKLLNRFRPANFIKKRLFFKVGAGVWLCLRPPITRRWRNRWHVMAKTRLQRRLRCKFHWLNMFRLRLCCTRSNW